MSMRYDDTPSEYEKVTFISNPILSNRARLTLILLLEPLKLLPPLCLNAFLLLALQSRVILLLRLFLAKCFIRCWFEGQGMLASF